MQSPETYISIDIESDGPCPGLHSMLSLGAAALQREHGLLDTFCINLEALPEATPHPATMAWWRSQPIAYAQVRAEPQEPSIAMSCFRQWLEGLPRPWVAVAYPACFDFAFVNYYCCRFLGENPLGFAALDIKSYAMAALELEHFRASVKSRMPRRWFAGCPPHTHLALDDALEQGQLWLNILRERLG
ncbi:MAG: 3'-5' exoribonuclease [Myxococcota bacterium]|jgi:hypothetical protein|nr:3'-5' exoribonuclease [Myxococcota bacterium]